MINLFMKCEKLKIKYRGKRIFSPDIGYNYRMSAMSYALGTQMTGWKKYWKKKALININLLDEGFISEWVLIPTLHIGLLHV